jgi:IS30 family transposase
MTIKHTDDLPEPHQKIHETRPSTPAGAPSDQEVSCSIRAIAHQLDRSPSTIKRELDRHRDKHGRYLPQTADHAARQQRHRPRQHKLLANPRLRKLVQCKLKPLLVTRPDQRLAAP